MWTKSGGGLVLGLGDDGFVVGGDVHVYPIDDLSPHVTGAGDGTNCWCGPVRDHEVEQVVVHNAMDERESYELGRPKH